MVHNSGLRVVVVGATGNVGTSVVEALGRAGEVGSIVAVARRQTEWRPPKTTLMQADVASDDLDEVVRGADVVVHLAWLFQPTRRTETTWNNNVLGAIRVFEAVARHEVPALVHASSVAAYSPGPSDHAVDEQWPTHGWPGAAYPREKAYLERWLDTFEVIHPEVRVVRMRPCFLFKRESATSQRRLSLGPLVPGRVATPRRIPVVPSIDGLRVQVLHTDDAADAYARAVLREVRGPFNLATDPPLDGSALAEMMGARRVPTARGAARTALAAAWHLHMVPASPGLFDTAVRIPLLDSTRARTVLGWEPSHTPEATLEEFLGGLHDGAGMPTAPLAEDNVRRRLHEVAGGVGQRA
ncbi:NAD-dependent epimerase/dehydratase family protein [Rhodococcus sp. NPDC003322]